MGRYMTKEQPWAADPKAFAERMNQRTAMFEPKFERGIRESEPGMAHFAGTGPENKVCRECSHFSNEGRYKGGKNPVGLLKPGRCGKYKKLTGQRGKAFSGDVKSCRHFAPNPNPPARIDEKAV